MTVQDLVKELKLLVIESEADEERAHRSADALLLNYIDDEQVTKTFDKIRKWYS